ncbi:Gfo/Idh/MocA family protein [Microbacterium sp. NPDC056569]|uniref:Gfo/Idh/MocA family protein n=1 Tax=Microbacterium sp. NPDC056569 TaxID=3345867 RepID=UPI00367035DF
MAGAEGLRYGIVGAGYFGKEFARILAEVPGAELAAVLSPEDADDLVAESGGRVVDSIDELIASVDAVIVASPNHAHREPAIAAAEAGRHVFCEKPVALSYAECDAMVAASEKAETLFLAGHILHFMPGIRRAADLIAAGAIGAPVFARTSRTGWEDGTAAPGWKKTRALSGGHLFHHIHELDILQHLIGPAESVSMTGGAAPQAGRRVGDEDAILLAAATFAGGRYATLEWGSVFRRPEHTITVQGTEGYLAIDLQDVGVTLQRGGETETFPLHGSVEADLERTRENRGAAGGSGVTYGDPARRPPRWLRAAMADEIAYFHGLATGARAVDPALAPLTDGSAARAAIATAEALTRALSLGRSVRVDEVTGGSLLDAA